MYFGRRSMSDSVAGAMTREQKGNNFVLKGNKFVPTK